MQCVQRVSCHFIMCVDSCKWPCSQEFLMRFLFFVAVAAADACAVLSHSAVSDCGPMDCSTPSLPVLTGKFGQLAVLLAQDSCPECWLRLMSIESVKLSNHLIFWLLFLLLPLIFPSIRVLWAKLVILEPKKIKSVTVSTFSPSICHEVMGLDVKILVF